MAEVTGFTADRMRQIENTTVVDGEVQGDNLVLLTREGTPIDAGNVRGPKGDQGIQGDVEEAPEDGKYYLRRNGLWTPKTFPNEYTPVVTVPKKDDRVEIQRGDGTMAAIELHKYNVPVYASTAARDADWPTPHNGARCVTNGYEQYYDVKKWVNEANIFEVVDGALVLGNMAFDPANNWCRTSYVGTKSRGILNVMGYGNPTWVSGSGDLLYYIPAPYTLDMPWGIICSQMQYRVAGDPGGVRMIEGVGSAGNQMIVFKVMQTGLADQFNSKDISTVPSTWPYGGPGWSVFITTNVPVVRTVTA